MKHYKILGNTYCIETDMSCIPYYKLNDRDIVMLDSGWGKGERDGIAQILDDNHFRVMAVINSHAHIDHTGNNMYFKKKYGTKIIMSQLEAALCQSATSVKAYMGGYSLENVQNHYHDMISDTDYAIMPDEDHVLVEGARFEILFTPGHSPEHIVITTPDNVTYVGDSLISYDVMKGAKMPYAFLLSEDLKSKEKLKTLNSDAYVVAHKGVFKDIMKLIEDNIGFYMYRADRVKDVLIHPMTRAQTFNAVVREFNIKIRSIDGYHVIDKMMHSFLDYLREQDEVYAFFDSGFIKFAKKTKDS